MRNHIAIRKLLYSASTFGISSVATCATLLGLVNEIQADLAPYSEWPQVVLTVASSIQTYSLPLFVVLAGIGVLAAVIHRLGDPWVWEKLQFILNEYQAKVFEDRGNEPNHHHRVTLFQYKKCYWAGRHFTGSRYRPWGTHNPYSGWLVPVLRSGHTSQNTKAIFLAPDNADKAEGVAGKAWAAKTAVVVNELPEMKTRNRKSERETYACATTTSVEFVEKCLADGKVMPRSIAATPVESNGNLWGVVVVDSRSPDGVTERSVLDYQLTVALIGQLLEKAT